MTKKHPVIQGRRGERRRTAKALIRLKRLRVSELRLLDTDNLENKNGLIIAPNTNKKHLP